jgi:GNAT superfamily N-acetyltransferase
MDRVLRLLTRDDIDWVTALFQANARDNLTEEQRRNGGFVQGKLDAEMIAGRIDGPASVVTLIDGRGVGAILTASADEYTQGPPALAVAAAKEAGLTDFYLYGPGVVAQECRGQGILRALKDESIRIASQAGKYRWAVGFVEHSNQPSMIAHEKTGWQSVATFSFKDRTYDVIAHPVPALQS